MSRTRRFRTNKYNKHPAAAQSAKNKYPGLESLSRFRADRSAAGCAWYLVYIYNCTHRGSRIGRARARTHCLLSRACARRPPPPASSDPMDPTGCCRLSRSANGGQVRRAAAQITMLIVVRRFVDSARSLPPTPPLYCRRERERSSPARGSMEPALRALSDLDTPFYLFLCWYFCGDCRCCIINAMMNFMWKKEKKEDTHCGSNFLFPR